MTLQTLVIQITTKCPYHCPQCYMQKGNEDISLDAVRQVAEPFAAQGGRATQLTGGEPLAYPDLPALLRYLRGLGLRNFLATSGYRHSPELYAELKACGLDILCVSINDISENVNRLTRDAYEEGIAAIRDACEVGLPVCANVVVSDGNIDNFELFAHYLARRGVGRIDVLRPVASFDGGYVPSVSQETLGRLAEIVRRNPQFYRVENCYREYWAHTTGEPFVCRDVAQKSLFVNADGTVSPCSKLQGYRYPTVDALLHDAPAWRGKCK